MKWSRLGWRTGSTETPKSWGSKYLGAMLPRPQSPLQNGLLPQPVGVLVTDDAQFSLVPEIVLVKESRLSQRHSPVHGRPTSHNWWWVKRPGSLASRWGNSAVSLAPELLVGSASGGLCGYWIALHTSIPPSAQSNSPHSLTGFTPQHQPQ